MPLFTNGDPTGNKQACDLAIVLKHYMLNLTHPFASLRCSSTIEARDKLPPSAITLSLVSQMSENWNSISDYMLKVYHTMRQYQIEVPQTYAYA